MSDENTPMSPTDQAMLRLRELQEKRDPRPESLIPPLPAEKEIHPVSGKPKKKKFSTKLREALFSEDIGNGSLSDYVFFKVLIPKFKDIVLEIGNTTLAMALGKDPRLGRRSGGATHTSNASLYAANNRDQNFNRLNSGSGYGRREALSELIWDEETASDIYQQCIDLLARYPTLSVGNVYGIMGLPQYIRITDKNWGWSRSMAQEIEMVPVDPEEHTYRIVFPPVQQI